MTDLFAEWDRIPVFVGVQRQAKIGGWVVGVVDAQFIREISQPIIFDNGNMQMDSHGVGRVTGIISHFAKVGSCFHEDFPCACWELVRDEGIALRVGHVCVIDPDLTAGMKRVLRQADDDGGYPVRLAGQVSRIGGEYGGNPGLGPPEDIKAGMTMPGSKRIVPDETDQPIRGKVERCIVAARSSFHSVFRQGRLVLKPRVDPVRSWGGTTTI